MGVTVPSQAQRIRLCSPHSWATADVAAPLEGTAANLAGIGVWLPQGTISASTQSADPWGPCYLPSILKDGATWSLRLMAQAETHTPQGVQSPR